MRKVLVIAIISFLILVQTAFALNVTVSVDKTRVFMGDNVTLTGKITLDDGSTKSFEYRAAFVGPKRVIICDTNKTMTASDGTFTLKCKIPTAQEANNSGIPAALTRAVVPYKAGVTVNDTSINGTVKRYAKTIIAVNPEKFNNQLNEIIQRLDTFVNNSRIFAPECNRIAETAARFNLTNITMRCLEIQQKIDDLNTNITAISDQARQLKNNINATDFESFRDSLNTLKSTLKDLRDELKDIKDAIRAVRWDTVKEVKSSISDIRKDIEEKRGEIRDLRNKSEIRSGVR